MIAQVPGCRGAGLSVHPSAFRERGCRGGVCRVWCRVSEWGLGDRVDVLVGGGWILGATCRAFDHGPSGRVLSRRVVRREGGGY